MSAANIEPLLTVPEAARMIGIKASALRTEIRKGRLRPIVIASKFYFTRNELQDMIDRCRAEPKDPDSTLGDHAAGISGGSSSTEEKKLAQASALRTLERLKKGLPTT